MSSLAIFLILFGADHSTQARTSRAPVASTWPFKPELLHE